MVRLTGVTSGSPIAVSAASSHMRSYLPTVTSLLLSGDHARSAVVPWRSTANTGAERSVSDQTEVPRRPASAKRVVSGDHASVPFR
jgi:hypothetical protein